VMQKDAKEGHGTLPVKRWVLGAVLREYRAGRAAGAAGRG